MYWRGSAAMRERIEAEIRPDTSDRRERRTAESIDPQLLLDEVQQVRHLRPQARTWAVTGAYRSANAAAGGSPSNAWSPALR